MIMTYSIISYLKILYYVIRNTKITFYSEKLKNSSDSKILGIFGIM